MATGKQLSFRAGEISSEFQFNTLAPSYAEGLAKLENGFIKNTGGAANRSGFLRVYENPMRTSAASNTEDVNANVYDNAVAAGQGAGPKITAFTFWNEFERRYDILELGYFNAASPSTLMYRYNFGTPTVITTRTTYAGAVITFPHDLAQMRFCLAGERLIITPYFKVVFTMFGTAGMLPNLCFNIKEQTFELVTAQNDKIIYPASLLVAAPAAYSKGQSPILPVAYILTAEDDQGFEYPIGYLETDNSNPNTWDPSLGTNPAPWYPHAQMYTVLSWPLAIKSTDLDTHKIRCYRAAWTGDEERLYKLVAVGRIQLSGSDYQFVVSDYGEENAAITPPTQQGFTIQPLQTITFTPLGGVSASYTQALHSLAQATAVAFHQGRLHSYIENPPEDIFDDDALTAPWIRPYKAEGEFLASKLNVPHQNNPPLIFTDLSAFSYKIKEVQGSKPLAYLPMKRLIILTSEGAFMCGGSPSGVLTPTEVNPERISGVGVNSLVEPKMSGRRGYYLASDNSRVMGIVWGDGAQASYNIFELSMFSSHLLEGESFVRMEALSNRENSIVLLTSMGRLIHATTQDEAAIGGFSRFSLTSGYVENIFLTKMKAYYKDTFEAWEQDAGYRDVLGAYVIRNGIRRFEILSLREEDDTLTFCYMDSAMPFGLTLLKKGGQYIRATYPAYHDSNVSPNFSNDLKSNAFGYFFTNQIQAAKFNIGHTTTTAWTAGTAIDLFCSVNISDAGGTATTDIYRLDFYYNDEEGNIRTLRGTVDLLTSVASSGGEPLARKMSVVFDTDVPTSLRNVIANATLTAEEKDLRMTRWNLAFNFVPEAMATELYNRRPPEIPLGEDVPISVYCDRTLISSPLNPDYAERLAYLVWDAGTSTASVQFPDEDDFYAFGFIGFPYKGTVITLPIEPSDNRTLTNGNVIVNSVTMGLNKSMDFWMGLPGQKTSDMSPIYVKDSDTDDFVSLPEAFSGKITPSVPSRFEDGKIQFDLVDPLPFTLLSIYPNGQAS